MMIHVNDVLNENVCYIKPAFFGGNLFYYVFTHDGVMVSGFEDRATAFAVARLHDLFPMSMH